MKIIFDHQIFSLQANGGISRYIYHLQKELKKLGVDARIRVSWSENVYVPHARKLPRFLPWRIRQLLYFGLNTLCDILFPERSIDILHATYYGASPLRKYAKKLAVTVHDMLHEDGYARPSLLDRTTKAKEKIVREADVIVTVSYATKDRVCHHYQNLHKKIHVTYHGTDIGKWTRIELKKPIKSNYILYVGNRGGYKHFTPYLRAVAPILKKRRVVLVAFGGGDFSTVERSEFERIGIADLVTHVSGDDRKLAQCYQHALFLVYPSLSEGFGLPIIEAMTLGCPVLTSDRSSMKEIGGENVIFMNPDIPEDMAKKSMKLLQNNTQSPMLHIKNNNPALHHLWSKTAEKTLSAYKKSLAVVDNI